MFSNRFMNLKCYHVVLFCDKIIIVSFHILNQFIIYSYEDKA